MKYNFDELNEVGKWLLCTANTDALEAALYPHPNQDKIEVTVLINGVNVGIDFDKSMIEIDNQLELLIQKRARILLQNKFADLIQELQNLQESIEFLEF